MSVPTYDRFVEPILRFLATRPEGASAREAHEAAADALKLSEEQRHELISSGQAVYKNRAGWAHDRLKRAGLSGSPRRGQWKLTEVGVAYAARHAAPLPADEIERLATEYVDVRLRASANVPPLEAAPKTVPLVAPSTTSPDDRLVVRPTKLATKMLCLSPSPATRGGGSSIDCCEITESSY